MEVDLDKIDLVTQTPIKTPLRASRPKRHWIMITGLVGLIIIVIIIGGLGWWLLKPANKQAVEVTIAKGDSLATVLHKLERQGIIRSAELAKIYFKTIGKAPTIQAGNYQIVPRLGSLEQVLTSLNNAKVDERKVTFYPGATINFRNSKTDTTPSHREVLRQLGFDDRQIDQALNQVQKHRLFKLLPAVTNLEGLIFGETYHVAKTATAEQVLNRSLDHFYKVIVDNQLVDKYQARGLTLYQALIIASIVEREVPNQGNDRAQVAQVFVKRHQIGMQLGSDITYQYASRLAGVDNDLYIKSPYNTRQVVGLPPTPIASPSLSSLLAVANYDLSGEYLYFVSGDDDKTYFAKTLAEHERNVKQYCHKKCSVF